MASRLQQSILGPGTAEKPSAPINIGTLHVLRDDSESTQASDNRKERAHAPARLTPPRLERLRHREAAVPSAESSALKDIAPSVVQ